MSDQRRPRFPGAGDDVDHARGQVDVAEDLGQQQRRERRGFGGLEDDGVAAGQGRCQFPGGHEQREVPRDDLSDDAVRGHVPVREGVLELVGPAGVVEEVGGDQRQVDVATLTDRLAAVHCLEHGELPGTLLELAGDAVEVAGPHRAGSVAPVFLEGRAGGGDCTVYVFGAAFGDGGEPFLGRRVDGVERAARTWFHELSADKEAVLVGEADDRGRLGCRGVVEPEVGDRIVGRRVRHQSTVT